MPRPRHHHSNRHAAEALVRTAPLVSRWIERLLAGHEPPLTVAQYLALQAVGEGEVVGSELARRTAVSRAAVSQLLAALETAGLLERSRLADDRRRQPLALTEQGEWTLRSAQPCFGSASQGCSPTYPRPRPTRSPACSRGWKPPSAAPRRVGWPGFSRVCEYRPALLLLAPGFGDALG